MGIVPDRYLIAISLLSPYIAPKSLNALVKDFTPEEFFTRKAWLNQPLSEEILAHIKNLDWAQVDKIAAWCEKNGVQVLGKWSHSYPEKLSRLTDAPVVLYLWGEVNFSEQAVAVVGTRNPTNYGREVAYRIAKELAEAGLIIVSGLARGLDSVAHQAALDARGKTIAVLGSGFQHIYPPENKGLAERILATGFLISEYPPDTSPKQWHFPARNRIIAAISEGVVVVEAGEESGALITCDFALDMGVEVYAVPGSILSPSSKGCHRLIKEGAKLVESAQDILEDFHLQLFPKKLTDPDLTSEERKVLEALTLEPILLEDLLQKLNLETSSVLAALAVLEVKGLIRSLLGNYFVKC